MESRDFEVHVGFPKGTFELASTVKRIPGSWKEKPAIDSVRGSTCAVDPHSVPGSLGLLLTQHVSTIPDAVLLANAVADACVSEPNVRIELEEVLLVQHDAKNKLVSDYHPFDPTSGCIEQGQIVVDTPPFEVHFGIRPTLDTTLTLTTQQIFDRACQCGVDIDEAVRFGDSIREKVILTKFIYSFNELAEHTTDYGDAIRNGFDIQDNSELEMKLVAERIILCAEPRAKTK